MAKFRKGESGNPNGRPKGSPNLGRIVTESARRWSQIEREVEVTDPATGKRSKQTMTLLDAVVLRVIDRAMKGDNYATKLLFNYVDGMPPQEVSFEGTVTTTSLSEMNLSDEDMERVRNRVRLLLNRREEGADEDSDADG